MSAPPRPIRIPIAEYEPADGDHLCSLWTDPATDRAAGRRYLNGAGGADGRLAILDRSRDTSPSAAEVSAGLAGDGVAMYTTDEVHVKGDYFDAERMRRFWTAASERMRTSGLRHLRAVAEMAWEIRDLPGSDGAGVFESSLNPLFTDLPASVICQYGSTKFAPKTLLAMILAHPLIVIGETVFANPFHVPDSEFAARLEAESRDPEAALLKVWTHFLSLQPSLDALARYVCNSIPTMIPSDAVLAAFSGLPAPLALEVVRDEVVEADEQQWRRLQMAAARSRSVGEGPWGAVRAADSEGLALLTASLNNDRHVVTATRNGEIPARDQLRFAAMAWDIAQAVHAFEGSPAGRNGGGTPGARAPGV